MAVRCRGSRLVVGCAVLAHLCLVPESVAGQEGADGHEWRHYGGDAGSTKYSPLAEITPDGDVVWQAEVELGSATTRVTWIEDLYTLQ